jgi:hypothetical protein
VFPITLVGPLTDAVEKVAIVHECRPALTESPGLGTATEGYPCRRLSQTPMLSLPKSLGGVRHLLAQEC